MSENLDNNADLYLDIQINEDDLEFCEVIIPPNEVSNLCTSTSSSLSTLPMTDESYHFQNSTNDQICYSENNYNTEYNNNFSSSLFEDKFEDLKIQDNKMSDVNENEFNENDVIKENVKADKEEEKLNTSDGRKRSSNLENEFEIGDLIWAKMSKFPYWPSIVCNSPEGIYYQIRGRTPQIHVAYLGKYIERNWVAARNVIRYTGLQSYNEMKANLPKKALEDHKVRMKLKEEYEIAVNEAEDALKLPDNEARFDEYGVEYSMETDEESEEDDNSSSQLIPKTKIKQKRCKIISKRNNPSEKSKANRLKKIQIVYSKFEFERLDRPIFRKDKVELVCFICAPINQLDISPESDTKDVNESVVRCSNSCRFSFHPSCLKSLYSYLVTDPTTNADISSTLDIDYTKCIECFCNIRRCCLCRKAVKMAPSTDLEIQKSPSPASSSQIEDSSDIVVMCSATDCFSYFHRSCMNQSPARELSMCHSKPNTNNCTSHVCYACYRDDTTNARQAKVFIRCIQCHATYHRGEWCIPAGSIEINDFYIICPQHLPMSGNFDWYISPFVGCIRQGQMILKSEYQLDKGGLLKHNNSDNIEDLWKIDTTRIGSRSQKNHNVNWCMICSNGGKLICCDKCPTSLHEKCVKSDVDISNDSKYLCENCVFPSEYPRYGDIFWVKYGNHKWCPGQIIHPRNIPERIIPEFKLKSGQFPVQFFKYHNYCPANRKDVYHFEDQDEEDLDDEANREASDALKARSKLWLKLIDRSTVPPFYYSIKSNLYSEALLPYKRSKAKNQRDNICSCRLDSKKEPCGSDCDNRLLQEECDPTKCINRLACTNQGISRRKYPKQEIYYTGEGCGWGLRASEDISMGMLVNEYVGEMITIEESKQRSKLAHINNYDNYYLMQIRNNLVIDARYAGNKSRFMNHSCDPNVECTQWNVQGETRVGIFAKRDIKSGEALTFDYKYTGFEDVDVVCKCGSAICRGTLNSNSNNTAGIAFTEHRSDTVRNKVSKRSKSSGPIKSRDQSIQLTNDVPADRTATTPSGPPPIGKTIGTIDRLYDELCFRCNQANYKYNEIVQCNYPFCPRVYHESCLDIGFDRLEFQQKSDWMCPWHYCDKCGRYSNYFCLMCTTSLCRVCADTSDKILSLGTFSIRNNKGNVLTLCRLHKDQSDLLNEFT